MTILEKDILCDLYEFIDSFTDKIESLCRHDKELESLISEGLNKDKAGLYIIRFLIMLSLHRIITANEKEPTGIPLSVAFKIIELPDKMRANFKHRVLPKLKKYNLIRITPPTRRLGRPKKCIKLYKKFPGRPSHQISLSRLLTDPTERERKMYQLVGYALTEEKIYIIFLPSVYKLCKRLGSMDNGVKLLFKMIDEIDKMCKKLWETYGDVWKKDEKINSVYDSISKTISKAKKEILPRLSTLSYDEIEKEVKNLHAIIENSRRITIIRQV